MNVISVLNISVPTSFNDSERCKLLDFINREIIFESTTIGQLKLDEYFRNKGN